MVAGVRSREMAEVGSWIGVWSRPTSMDDPVTDGLCLDAGSGRSADRDLKIEQNGDGDEYLKSGSEKRKKKK